MNGKTLIISQGKTLSMNIALAEKRTAKILIPPSDMRAQQIEGGEQNTRGCKLILETLLKQKSCLVLLHLYLVSSWVSNAANIDLMSPRRRAIQYPTRQGTDKVATSVEWPPPSIGNRVSRPSSVIEATRPGLFPYRLPYPPIPSSSFLTL
jgi:hypothetical protein